MTQARQSQLALTYCYKNITDSIELERFVDEWRNENSHQQNAAASLKEIKEWASQTSILKENESRDFHRILQNILYLTNKPFHR